MYKNCDESEIKLRDQEMEEVKKEMEKVKNERVFEAKSKLQDKKKMLQQEKQRLMREVKSRLAENRPIGGSSMIGENMKDFMIGSPSKPKIHLGGGGSLQVSPKNADQSSSESQKGKLINQMLLKKALGDQPQTTKVSNSAKK